MSLSKLDYVVKKYQKGFEQGQARIGIDVARKWNWPFAYDLDDLSKTCARSDFDPDTRHYCFLGNEMVGYLFFDILPPGEDGMLTANLEFPRMLPGHEHAAELLLESSFETLREKGVSLVKGRVTTMCPGDIRLAEEMGFSIHDWGYKIYYNYEMGWGSPDNSDILAEEIDPEVDLDECARIATHWYKRPAEWCLSLLKEWHDWGIITHLGVRQSGKWVAACLVAPNVLKPSIAALYYVYSPDEHSLESILTKAVKKCIDYGTHNLIVDLVNEHRHYEPLYKRVGFEKVAEWARCERYLT